MLYFRSVGPLESQPDTSKNRERLLDLRHAPQSNGYAGNGPHSRAYSAGILGNNRDYRIV